MYSNYKQILSELETLNWHFFKSQSLVHLKIYSLLIFTHSDFHSNCKHGQKNIKNKRQVWPVPFVCNNAESNLPVKKCCCPCFPSLLHKASCEK